MWLLYNYVPQCANIIAISYVGDTKVNSRINKTHTTANLLMSTLMHVYEHWLPYESFVEI